MKLLDKLRRKPRHFQAFTGLTPTQFETILAEFLPVYQAAYHNKRDKPGRQRQPGAGHPFTLAVPERLLMGLMYLRLYASQSLLSYLFDLDASNVSREIRLRLVPILTDILPTPLQDAPLRDLSGAPTERASGVQEPLQPDPKRKKRINTLQELLTMYPEIADVLIDATEQPIPQPEDKLKRKQAYSGKQQDHTVKTQIVATKKTILHPLRYRLRRQGPKIKANRSFRIPIGAGGTLSSSPLRPSRHPISRRSCGPSARARRSR